MVRICGKDYPEDIEELDISNKGLTKLPDEIQYLTNLKKLICQSNQITSLDNLPPNLQELYCNNNKITRLDNLPLNLQKLDCSRNEITSLDNLPPNLKTLDCSINPLIYTFEPTITNIRAYHNQ